MPGRRGWRHRPGTRRKTLLGRSRRVPPRKLFAGQRHRRRPAPCPDSIRTAAGDRPPAGLRPRARAADGIPAARNKTGHLPAGCPPRCWRLLPPSARRSAASGPRRQLPSKLRERYRWASARPAPHRSGFPARLGVAARKSFPRQRHRRPENPPSQKARRFSRSPRPRWMGSGCPGGQPPGANRIFPRPRRTPASDRTARRSPGCR